jgi:carbonic anhydrase
VDQIDRVLADNAATATPPVATDHRPSRRLAIVTCMDTRIDVLGALGLRPGEAHIIRNAGGRVTEDVLRSLALSTRVLGVDTVVVMQHTKCGLAGTTDEALRELTGAPLRFLAIDDHQAALGEDVDVLAGTSYLSAVGRIAALIYDVETGLVSLVTRWVRGEAG